jgi:hypothetical protein
MANPPLAPNVIAIMVIVEPMSAGCTAPGIRWRLSVTNEISEASIAVPITFGARDAVAARDAHLIKEATHDGHVRGGEGGEQAGGGGSPGRRSNASVQIVDIIYKSFNNIRVRFLPR